MEQSDWIDKEVRKLYREVELKLSVESNLLEGEAICKRIGRKAEKALAVLGSVNPEVLKGSSIRVEYLRMVRVLWMVKLLGHETIINLIHWKVQVLNRPLRPEEMLRVVRKLLFPESQEIARQTTRARRGKVKPGKGA
jgi:hypothetical protein